MVATVSPTVDSDQLITTTVAHKNMQILRKPKQNKNKNLTCLKKNNDKKLLISLPYLLNLSRLLPDEIHQTKNKIEKSCLKLKGL